MRQIKTVALPLVGVSLIKTKDLSELFTTRKVYRETVESRTARIVELQNEVTSLKLQLKMYQDHKTKLDQILKGQQ